MIRLRTSALTAIILSFGVYGDDVRALHDSQLIEGGAYLMYGPFNTDIYNYSDLSKGKFARTYSKPQIGEPGLEGALYPLNIISKFFWQPPKLLAHTLFALGIEGSAAIILGTPSVHFASAAECEKFGPCGQTTGGDYPQNIYSQNLGRYGIQYKMPLYILDNGMAIKLRLAAGQYYTHIEPYSNAKAMFSAININLEDTTVRDFYIRTFLTFEIPIANFPFISTDTVFPAFNAASRA